MDRFDDYRSVCVANSGVVVPFEVNEKNNKANVAIRQMTKEVARKLEIAGIHTETQDELFRLTFFTQQVSKEPGYRNINILPSVAKRNRAKHKNALQLYLSKKKYCRFWTVTGGTRVFGEDLRERNQRLERHVSRLNGKKWFREDAGLSIVFRASEQGSVIWENGRPTYHPHVHLVIATTRKLPEVEWSALLSKCHDYFGTVWEDSGRLRSAYEVCKYIGKPSDTANHSPEDLRIYHNALFGLHLMSPMGEFRDELRYLKESGQKVQRVKTEDGWELTVKRSVNSVKKGENPSKKDKWKHRSCKNDDDERWKTEKPPLKNFILSRNPPGPYANRVMEPSVTVMGFDGNFEAIYQNPLIKEFREAAWPEWIQGMMTLEAEENRFPGSLTDHLDPVPGTIGLSRFDRKLKRGEFRDLESTGLFKSTVSTPGEWKERLEWEALKESSGLKGVRARSAPIKVLNTTITVPAENRKMVDRGGSLPSFPSDRPPKVPPGRVAPQEFLKFQEKRQSVSGLPSLLPTGTRPVSESYAI